MRERRRAVSARDASRAAERLRRLALHHGLILRPRHIGFYVPLPEEINLLPLLNHALWQHRACYLPSIPRRGARRLWFNRITGQDAWYRNRFGILEHGSFDRRRAQTLDVVFMPLVAFDKRGNRLGMGGGFYDASLAHLRQRAHFRKPKLIGVAYDFQRVDVLPHEPWDVKLDAVITDRKLYRFSHVSTTEPG